MAENVISMDKKQTKEEKNLESFVAKNKKGMQALYFQSKTKQKFNKIFIRLFLLQRIV